MSDVPPNLEYVGGPGKPSLLAEIDGCKIHAVRWAVLPGVDAEGLLIEPKDRTEGERGRDSARRPVPEDLAGRRQGDDFALRLARERLPRPRPDAHRPQGRPLRQPEAEPYRPISRTASSSTAWPTRWAAPSSATRCRRYSRRWTGSEESSGREGAHRVGVIGTAMAG